MIKLAICTCLLNLGIILADSTVAPTTTLQEKYVYQALLGINSILIALLLFSVKSAASSFNSEIQELKKTAKDSDARLTTMNASLAALDERTKNMLTFGVSHAQKIGGQTQERG